MLANLQKTIGGLGHVRRFSTLVLAEQFNGKINTNFGNSLTAATYLAEKTVDVLVHGDEASVESQVAQVKKYPSIDKIIVAKHDSLKCVYGDQVARIAKHALEQHGYNKIIAPSSSFGKDVIPRLGGLCDMQPITDVIEIINKGEKFVRPIYAGNAVCTVSSKDPVKLLTIRPTNFEKVESVNDHDYPIEELDVSDILSGLKGEGIEDIATESEMADLATATFVVSGGRGMKNGDNFKMLYELADIISKGHCAVGASRAAVDAGMVPNDLQVGQTGKVVAPDLYIAVGISGAIQHLAGMKDSKIIVAINKDPEAPIFKVANYGLVADLFKAVPELAEKLKE